MLYVKGACNQRKDASDLHSVQLIQVLRKHKVIHIKIGLGHCRFHSFRLTWREDWRC